MNLNRLIFSAFLLLGAPLPSYSESNIINQLIINLKTGKPILEQKYERQTIEKVILSKKYYLVVISTSSGGVCSSSTIKTYNHQHKEIDSLTIEEICDTDGGEYQSLNYEKYNNVGNYGGSLYHLKTIRVKNGYEGTEIIKYISKEYHLDYIGNIHSANSFNYCKDIKYPELSKQKLIEGSLKNVPLETLQLMRNEVFARYGYVFTSSKVNNYFLSCPWYKPTLNNTLENITQLEKDNLKIVKQQESKLKNVPNNTP